ncbi:MAG: hypothetical protein LBP72_06555 [Dysgonamonadaceae bacterium]|jgi:hypothetical protein|nr:hypothetical protein [Dysgonamonadaceae bacterium]
MKKLVLSVAIVAVVALSACKKEAPAQAPEETQIEAPAPVTEEVPVATEEASAPAEEVPAPAETPAQ